MEAREALRVRLKSAVAAQAVPPGLETRMRATIRAEADRRTASAWWRWAVAACAMLVVGVATWTIYPPGTPALPDLTDRHAQDTFIQRVASTMHATLGVGLGDHLHCSIFRQRQEKPPSLEEMARSMGPAYQELLPLVKARVPEDYRVVQAHQCGYLGRRFVHLAMRKDEHVISLIVTRRQTGETLAGMAPSLRAGSVSVYQAAAHDYQVAGFETAEHLAFVVSDLGRQRNLQLARDLAPAVHGFLASMRG